MYTRFKLLFVILFMSLLIQMYADLKIVIQAEMAVH